MAMMSASSFFRVSSTSLDSCALGDAEVSAAFRESIFHDINLSIILSFLKPNQQLFNLFQYIKEIHLLILFRKFLQKLKAILPSAEYAVFLAGIYKQLH